MLPALLAAGQRIYDCVQFLHINRLDEVLDKSGLFAVRNILWQSKAAQGNGGQRRFTLAKFAEQLQTAPVGQAEISDEKIKLLAPAQLDRTSCIGRGTNGVASRLQETLHALAGISVIFHQQDVSWRPSTGPPGFRRCFSWK